MSELLALALPVANLALVEGLDESQVVVPCAACFRRLKAGHAATRTDPVMAARIDQADLPHGVGPATHLAEAARHAAGWLRRVPAMG